MIYLKNLNKLNYEEIIKKYIESNICFNLNIISNSESETRALALIFAKYIKNNSILVLNGELGSGKTVFMSGIGDYFNIKDKISSPTFTIVNEYDILDNKNISKIFHFDLYRLKSMDEFLYGIGTDYFSEGACVIEWGEIINDILPDNTIHIEFTKDKEKENTRYLKIWRD